MESFEKNSNVDFNNNYSLKPKGLFFEGVCNNSLCEGFNKKQIVDCDKFVGQLNLLNTKLKEKECLYCMGNLSVNNEVHFGCYYLIKYKKQGEIETNLKINEGSSYPLDSVYEYFLFSVC